MEWKPNLEFTSFQQIADLRFELPMSELSGCAGAKRILHGTLNRLRLNLSVKD
jgi:hypothetical protein